MKESTAWRKIARKLERDGSCYEGLCHEVYVLDVPFWGAEVPMKQRIAAHLNAMERPFLNGHGARYLDRPGVVGPRILAAYFLALEAEEEGQ